MPKILVVEDNPSTLKLVQVTLESAGYSVLSARDGRSALSLVEEDPPALILQDLLLPDMDGFDLLHRFRSTVATRAVPALALSGMTEKIELGRRMGLAFSGYLLKPVEPSRLLQAVQELVPVAREDPAPELSLQGRLVLVADDDPIQRKLLSIRLAQFGVKVQSASNGQEALDMVERWRPDAVVSDVLMPHLDGFGLCRAIRQEPALAHTPVILISAAYVEEEDRRLAEQVGATAFVARSPGFTDVITAMESCWRTRPRGQSDTSLAEPTSADREHRHSVFRQLERQVSINMNLTEDIAVQKAQLAILAGMSEVLTRTTDIEEILEELVVRCLEVTGFSVGAAYLLEPDGTLVRRTQMGYAGASTDYLDGLAIHTDVLFGVLQDGKPLLLPSDELRPPIMEGLSSRSQATAVIITPVTCGSRHHGVLVMGTTDEKPPTGALDFVQAVGAQIGQAIALGQTYHQLADSERHFRNIAETAAETILQTDRSGKITYINPAGERLFDYPDGSALGLPCSTLLPTLPEQQGIRQIEGQASTGHRIPVEVSTRATSDPSGRLTLTHVIRDLTERKRFESQLVRAVNYDPLTDLFNRRRFFEELDRSLALCKQFGVRSAVLLLDLDQFKYLNDSLGYQAGDVLLKSAAGRLQKFARDREVLARIEGDQFAVLVPDTSPQAAKRFAQVILKDLSEELGLFRENPLRITASMGIAMVTGQEQRAEEVFNRAEAALYEAKGLGRNRCVLYERDPTQPEGSQEQVDWRRRLSDALWRGQFRLWFQPIVDLRRMQTVAFEALLRMVDEHGNLILPGEFLHIAEQSGLAGEIDQWVVRKAIQTVADHHRLGEKLFLEVNLSARSLTDPNLLPLIQEALDETGIPPESLCFEITETAAITNLIEAQSFISTLRAKGCRFALDDFGIGFSSFYYLKNLPVDIIKIDGSFIRDLPRSHMDQQLVRAITTVAVGSGKQTIAEFVQDEDTLTLLRSLGVDFAQGYYLGRPAPSPDRSSRLPE